MNDKSEKSTLAQRKTEVEVLPPETVYPAAKSELDSHYKEIGWNNVKEVVADAFKLIPGLDKAIDYVMGTGEYSSENRLKEKQFKWLLEETARISQKLNILMTELPEDERPEPADVAAIMEAALKVSRKTAGSDKRKLLKNAVINSFDLDQYQNGLTLRFFSILENVEYGDVEQLRKINAMRENNTYGVSNATLHPSQNAERGALVWHHLKILEKQDLIFTWNQDGVIGSSQYGYCKVNDLGKKFLEFLRQPEITS